MHHHYEDIRSRISEPPLWFDENAVPRYVEFTPDEVANIYADEVCLVHIDCQGCGVAFKVAFSRSKTDVIFKPHSRPLEELILENELHYGDPPNVGCCAAGATMNSVPRRVLEYWVRCRGETEEMPGAKGIMVVKDPIDYMTWKRKSELERAIEPDWWDPEEPDLALIPPEPGS